MYSPSVPDAIIGMFGLAPGDLVEEVEVWPCNWPAFLLFNRMSTQWRAGAGGAIGLDYSCIRDVACASWRRKGKTARNHGHLFKVSR